MNNNKLYRFIIGMVFLISLVAFFMYIRTYLSIKGLSRIGVSSILEISLVRYRNIGVFCLILGFFLMFLNSLFSYINLNRNYYVKNDRVLDRISNNTYESSVTSSFDENNIINSLLKDKTLKVVFYSSNLKDKIVKFKEYDKKNNRIEFYDLSNDDIYKEERVVNTSKSIISPIKFVLNLIVILLCIILILLCINKISLRNKTIKNNFNINTIEKNINLR